MSLHTRWPRRIANISAPCTVRRQRGVRHVRHYSVTIEGRPLWFDQLRLHLLKRYARYSCEDLDLLHQKQMRTTLEGFVPRTSSGDVTPGLHAPLADVLTRFNVQVESSHLLPDGTDPLHSPGKPWVRRLWAGGAITRNPDRRLEFYSGFRLGTAVACVERIKDVRLQGEDDAAKIFVTIERRFASLPRLESCARNAPGELSARSYFLQQVRKGVEWGDAALKEERTLVFLPSIKGTELEDVKAGKTVVPRYLNAPTEPDFTHSLKPHRSLLFRYSALTFNAHLLHLDPTYARNVEGHRNLIVHGPLTLTLMLQTLTKHLRQTQVGTNFQAIDSFEYRNLAPLYCDESMRVCVKKKKKTESGHVWDVWIEGPNGGMAVKALARTKYRFPEEAPTQESVEAETSVSRTQQRKSHLLSAPGLSYLYHERSPLAASVSLPTKQHLNSESRPTSARSLFYLYHKRSPLAAGTRRPDTNSYLPAARGMFYLYRKKSALQAGVSLPVPRHLESTTTNPSTRTSKSTALSAEDRKKLAVFRNKLEAGRLAVKKVDSVRVREVLGDDPRPSEFRRERRGREDVEGEKKVSEE